jgi:TRAP-type uncharacterized transport system substrate-binding protein
LSFVALRAQGTFIRLYCNTDGAACATFYSMKTIDYLGLVLKHELIAIKESLVELRIAAIVILLLIGGIIVYLKPFPFTGITIATSYEGGDWYQFGKGAIAPLKEQGITVEVVATNGAIENAEKLNDRNSGVNAGFVYAAALSKDQQKELYSLGSISYDPVWIFYRNDLAGKIKTIQDLAKYRVALGPKKSGSYILSKKFFEFNGINIESNSNFISSSWEDSRTNFLSGKADVYIFVSTMLDPLVEELIHSPDMTLFNVSNALAYQKKYNYLDAVTIPAGSINIEKNIPANDISLIATTTTLAVRKDLHPSLQLALLMASKEIIQDSSRLFFSKRNEFPAYVDPSISISPTARNYYNYGPPKTTEYLPYWLVVFIDRFWFVVLAAFAVIYPLSKLNFHLRRFRFIIRKRPLYELLLNIEKEITGKKLPSEEKERLLKKLETINKHAHQHFIPVGEETDYFLFVNALQLLRNKIERN